MSEDAAKNQNAPAAGDVTASKHAAPAQNPPAPATVAPAGGAATAGLTPIEAGATVESGTGPAAQTPAPPVLGSPTITPSEASGAAGITAGARAAALIREQMEILTLRILYDTQDLLRPAAHGSDPVTIRQVLATLATALEKGDATTFAYTYSRTARPLQQQINDQVLPYQLGLQISSLFEGIIRDTFNQGFAQDPELRIDSNRLFDQLAAPAKRALLGEPQAIVQWQTPQM